MGSLTFLGVGDSLNPERAQTSVAVPLAGDETMLIDTSSGTVLLGRLGPPASRSNPCATCSSATATSTTSAGCSPAHSPRGPSRGFSHRPRRTQRRFERCEATSA